MQSGFGSIKKVSLGQNTQHNRQTLPESKQHLLEIHFLRLPFYCMFIM